MFSRFLLPFTRFPSSALRSVHHHTERRLFSTSGLSAAKRLSTVCLCFIFSSMKALKKEHDQEEEVLSSDYYDSENTRVKEFLQANPEWKITEKPLHSEIELRKTVGNEECGSGLKG